MSAPELCCWQCGANLDSEPLPLSRHASCEACFAPLHCCRQCQHYAPTAPQRCLEERADVPREADNANFCEYLLPSGTRRATGVEASAADNARAKLDALFAEPEHKGSTNSLEPE